jgi:hypothetical protein
MREVEFDLAFGAAERLVDRADIIVGLVVKFEVGSVGAAQSRARDY